MTGTRILWLVPALLLVAGLGLCQTSTPGDAIDVEVFSLDSGTNNFQVEPGETFWAQIFVGLVSPASYPEHFTRCSLACSPPDVTGGRSQPVTAVIGLEFDPAALTVLDVQNHTLSAARDGLIRVNQEAGRVGWALAGDWVVNGDPTSELRSPCSGLIVLDFPLVFRVQFRLDGVEGAVIHLRRASDADPFPLSFGDLCGPEAFTEANGGIDEVVDGIVNSPTSIFWDGFETGNTNRWSETQGAGVSKVIELEPVAEPGQGRH